MIVIGDGGAFSFATVPRHGRLTLFWVNVLVRMNWCSALNNLTREGVLSSAWELRQPDNTQGRGNVTSLITVPKAHLTIAFVGVKLTMERTHHM